MAETNEPAPPETPAVRPGNAPPRRNLSAERQAQPAALDDSEAAMVNFVDSVKVLAKHFTGDEAEPAETEDRPRKKIKKFQRSGLGDERPPLAAAADDEKAAEPEAKGAAVNPLAAAPTLPSEEKADAATFNKNIAWPRAGQVEAAEQWAASEAKPKRKKRKKGVVLAVVQGVGFGLLLLGFWLGRQTAAPEEAQPSDRRAAATPPAAGENYRIDERALQAANDALAAAHKGDSDDARKLFNDALSKYPEIPGVHYQLARLSLQSGDLLDADLHLDRSSDAGEFLAACCYSRARFAGMKGNYEEAVRQFQTAAHEEPFNGVNFFYWAEAMRREGRTLNAISIFDQAMERAHTTEEGVLYLFKQRLAKVETGSDEAFNAELSDHLKPGNTTGEWLLLSAAKDILQGAFPAAAAALKKATLVLPRLDYDLAIKDSLFQSAAHEPVLTALVQRPRIPDSTELNGPFVDPTVASPSLADPAIWPLSATSNPVVASSAVPAGSPASAGGTPPTGSPAPAGSVTPVGSASPAISPAGKR